MYCSRRGIETSKPSDACKLCGRCNWEQNSRSRKSSSAISLLLAAAFLLTVILFLMR